MNKSLVISFISVLLVLTSLAQPSAPPLGKAIAEELRMQKCPFDTTASAMYLLNSQDTKIEVGLNGAYWSTTTRRFRIKIFDQNGFKYANIKFPIRTSKYRKISDIKGFVYYTDAANNIITQKISRQDIYKDKLAKNMASIAFAFPNVRPGCVIEYTYTYEDEFSTSIPTWLIQYPIPTAVGYCKIEVPGSKRLNQKIVAQTSVKLQDTVVNPHATNKKNLRVFTAFNIPGFRPEPLMGPWRNHLQRIEFAMNLLPGIFDLFDKSKWGLVNAHFKLKTDEASQTELPGSDTIISNAKKFDRMPDRVEYIFNALKKCMKWDDVQTAKFGDIETVWKEKSGNSAELNLILLNMLRRSQVACAPMLISTREHGNIDKSFINPGQFNGIDVLAADTVQYFVLDLTRKYLSYKVPPYNVINTEALVVDSTVGQWVKISDPRSLFRQGFIIFSSLDSTGQLQGNATIEHFDYAKDAKLAPEEKDIEDADYISFKEDEQNVTIENKKTDTTTDVLLPLVELLDFKLPLSSTANLFFLNPSFLTDFRNNPFTSQKRSFDIDLRSNQSLSINFSVTLPENFTVEEMPKNVTLIKSDSTVMFKRISAIQGKLLQCLIRLEYRESYFAKEEYDDLREFFNRMHGLLNEPIILRKKD